MFTITGNRFLPNQSDKSDKSDGDLPIGRVGRRGVRRSGSTPEGCLFHSPGVEARSADDPGSPAIRFIYMRPLAGRSLQRSPLRPTPCGVEGRRGDVGFPGSSGLRPSDTRAMNNRPLPGSSPYRTSRTGLGVVLLSLLSPPSLSPPSAISQLSLLSSPSSALPQPSLSPPSLSPASLSPPSSALPPSNIRHGWCGVGEERLRSSDSSDTSDSSDKIARSSDSSDKAARLSDRIAMGYFRKGGIFGYDETFSTTARGLS